MDLTQAGFDEISINPKTGLKTGDNEITITYKEKTATVTVKVPVPMPEEDSTLLWDKDGNVTTDISKAEVITCTSRMTWGGSNTDQSGIANSAADDKGKENTDWIINNTDLDTTSGTIWYYCAQMRAATGDNRWYIPAAAELKAKYPNGCPVMADGSNGDIWSSSENPGGPTSCAYCMHSKGNLSDCSVTKNRSYYVVLFRAPATT